MKSKILVFSLSLLFVSNSSCNINMFKVGDSSNFIITRKRTNKSYSYGKNSDNSYNNYMSAYFENLTKNYLYNYKGSCFYTALLMLMSYYDTYNNDNFIDEKYDVNCISDTTDFLSEENSPGIQSGRIQGYTQDNSDQLNLTTYINYLKSQTNISFGANVLLWAKENGYGDATNENYFGVKHKNMLTILNNFTDTFLKPNDITLNIKVASQVLSFSTYKKAFTSSEIKNYTISMVKQGYPVLLNMFSLNLNTNEVDYTDGHSVIVYDYDEDNNLYFHMGGESNTSRIASNWVNIGTYYSAIVIAPKNSSHQHTNNYLLKNNNEETTYCYCNTDIKTWKHFHKYELNPTWISLTDHTVTCACGDTVTYKHVVELDNDNNYYCTICKGKASGGFISYE